MTNNFIVGALYSDVRPSSSFKTVLEFVRQDEDSSYFRYVEGDKCYIEGVNGLIKFPKEELFYKMSEEKTVLEKIYVELAEKFKDETNKNMILGYTLGVLEKNKKAIIEEYLELQKKVYGVHK